MELLDDFFWVPFAVIAAIIVFRMLKYGGIRGALYGSAVARTFGEIELAQKAGVQLILRVHVLEDGRYVLEQSSRAMLWRAIAGIVLSAADADRLIALLQKARS